MNTWPDNIYHTDFNVNPIDVFNEYQVTEWIGKQEIIPSQWGAVRGENWCQLEVARGLARPIDMWMRENPKNRDEVAVFRVRDISVLDTYDN